MGHCQSCAELHESLVDADYMGNLLAIVHCDGGHYRAEYGTKKATDDAIEIVGQLKQRLEEAETQLATALQLTTQASIEHLQSK